MKKYLGKLLRCLLPAALLAIMLVGILPIMPVFAAEYTHEIFRTSDDPLGNGALLWTRLGQRVTIPDRMITKIGFNIYKVGAVSGNVTFTIREIGDSIIASKVWGDAADLPTSTAYKEVTLDTPVTLNREVRISVEWSGGDSSNHLWSGYRSGDVFTGEYYTNYMGYGAWHDIGEAEECAYKYTYTEPGTPDLITSDATNIGLTSATIHGDLLATAGDDSTITFFWGDNDGGTTPGSWDNSSVPTLPEQPQGAGVCYKNLTGLIEDTTYYFTVRAANSYGTVWGVTKSFVTTVSAATIEATAATLIQSMSARLNGAVSATGNDEPTITFFWGDEDGGTTPGSWDNSVAPTSPSQPQDVGVCYKDIAGLTISTTYYFTIRAVNDGGTSWGATQTFATTSGALGTTTSYNATKYPLARKTFYAAGRHWVFYSSTTSDQGYRSSVDGATNWAEYVSIGTGDGKDLSVYYDGTYIHYARIRTADNFDIYYRRGIPLSDGTISWGVAEQTVLATSARYPSICVNSGGYPFISYYDFGDSKPKVIKSSTADGTWSTQSGYPYTLTNTTGSWGTQIVPLSDNDVYAVYAKVSSNVTGQKWTDNTTTWGSEDIITTLSPNDEFHMSATSSGNSIYLTYFDNANTQIRYIEYSAGAWGGDTLVYDTSDNNPYQVISLLSDTGNIRVFWTWYPSSTHMYYKSRIDGVWDTNPTDMGTFSLHGNDEISTSFKSENNRSGVLYLGGGSSPWSVKYTYILDTSPTVTASDATDIGFTVATLNGNVTVTGGENPTVTVYWGDNDGGEIPDNWDNSSAPDSPEQPQGVAAFYKDIDSLSASTIYYFTAKATNSYGTSWAETQSFATELGAPILDAIGDKAVNENVLLQFTANATDPNSDPLIYSVVNNPTGSSMNGTSGLFSWTPGYTQAGIYPDVQIIVTDNGSLTDSENITITVNNVNRAPVLAAIGNKSVTENATLQFIISASDPDSDPLVYSASNLPSGASFNGTTQEFLWTPDDTQSGVYPAVHFEVTDNSSSTDSEDITITVNDYVPPLPWSRIDIFIGLRVVLSIFPTVFFLAALVYFGGSLFSNAYKTRGKSLVTPDALVDIAFAALSIIMFVYLMGTILDLTAALMV